VHSYAESVDSFKQCDTILLKDENQPPRNFKIESVSSINNRIFLKLREVDDINQAKALVGQSVCILKQNLEKLAEHEYYWHELIGMEVWDRGHRYLGKIIAIFSTGSNDVYVVQKDSEEVLVPGTLEVVEQIDVIKGIMVVDLPEIL
jgi:16S rRNA processing protein RimM